MSKHAWDALKARAEAAEESQEQAWAVIEVVKARAENAEASLAAQELRNRDIQVRVQKAEAWAFAKSKELRDLKLENEALNNKNDADLNQIIARAEKAERGLAELAIARDEALCARDFSDLAAQKALQRAEKAERELAELREAWKAILST